MRWNKKKRTTDKKIVNRFAWLPYLIGDTWVWLEPYYELQKWCVIYNMWYGDDYCLKESVPNDWI